MTLFWQEREVTAEAPFVFFALLASLDFCFSLAFLTSSLLLTRFLCTSITEEFL
jgi:hypothetical protein